MGHHIAIITSGLTGIRNASLELVNRLTSEGHRITYMCPQNIQNEIESYRIEYVQLPEINFDIDVALKPFNEKSKRHLWFNEGKRLLKIDDFKRALSASTADKFLIDIELHELIFAAYELKKDITLISQFFENRFNPYIPPMKTKIIPGGSPNGTNLGILLAWIRTKAAIQKRILKKRQNGIEHRRFVLKQYAKEIGFKSSDLTASEFPPLFIHKKFNILSMVLGDLDFPSPIRYKNVYEIGPMVFGKRNENGLPQKTRDKINKLLKETSKKEGKLVYCTVSSLNKGDTVFLKRLVAAFKNLQGYTLIVSLGGKILKSVFGEIPENVFLFDWTPQLTILEKADLNINHGGMHTINECIHFKVPMLVYSGGLHDQNGCAARVAYHGLGIRGGKEDSIEKIRCHVKNMLESDIFDKTIQGFHEKYVKAKELSISRYI